MFAVGLIASVYLVLLLYNIEREVEGIIDGESAVA